MLTRSCAERTAAAPMAGGWLPPKARPRTVAASGRSSATGSGGSTKRSASAPAILARPGGVPRQLVGLAGEQQVDASRGRCCGRRCCWQQPSWLVSDVVRGGRHLGQLGRKPAHRAVALAPVAMEAQLFACKPIPRRPPRAPSRWRSQPRRRSCGRARAAPRNFQVATSLA